MGVSKVEFGGDTLIDLTSDTVTPETLAEGVTATNAAGNKIVGRMSIDPKAIIDVVELPTENIDEDMFYRVITGTFVYNQYVENAYTVHCVDGLPEVGEPATNADMSAITAYYNAQDGEAYGYVDDMLSQFFGVPIGWYSASMLFQAAGLKYKGIITDILDDPRDDSSRVLLEYVIYSYKDGKWTSNKTIGWAGDGSASEVFNLPWNKAYGMASHAEGRGTIAGVAGEQTYGQHAEGFETRALAEASHTEGYRTEARGEYSHAEGDNSYAEGYASHAEGNYSYAIGAGSHAEGNETFALGRCQHTQGEYNLFDPDYDDNDPFARGKYAHIVGNGTDDDNRSNAHTLDWSGVAWFAGDVKVGGTGQDDPNAKSLLDAINNTGGGSSTPSVSLIGTWTVIEEPKIPESDIPLEFTSNGTEYIGIGSTSMGSSSWGINALSYKSREGYYEAAYVNNPSGGYGITHGWRNEAYRYLTVTKEPESREAIAWLGANTDAPKVKLEKEQMPQIRFANFQDTQGTMRLYEGNPFTFTVEIVGGGELKEGDLLQICVRRKYWNKIKDTEEDFRQKWKLRKVLQREITAEDIGKRFLSINVTIADVTSKGKWMFRNDRKTSNVDTHSYMYFRIKRVTKWSDTTGEECDAIFSNVEKVAKTYEYSENRLAIK